MVGNLEIASWERVPGNECLQRRGSSKDLIAFFRSASCVGTEQHRVVLLHRT